MTETYAHHHGQRLVGQSSSRRQQPRRGSKPTKMRELRLRYPGGRNLQTKLSRCCGGAAYLFRRPLGRDSGAVAPRHHLIALISPCTWPLGRGHTKSISGAVGDLTRPSGTMAGPCGRRQGSIPTRLLPHARPGRYQRCCRCHARSVSISVFY